MIFNFAKSKVLNRGTPSDEFLKELVDIMCVLPDEVCAINSSVTDIFVKVKPELGPYTSLLYRKAVMTEVLRVLAMFESGGDWKEGVDTSRLGSDTPNNSEAGAWQVSYGSRNTAPGLLELLKDHGVTNGIVFQQKMKFDHRLAVEYVARLLRWNTKENGPLYKGDERLAIRKSLRGEEQSIYPWLFRKAVEEFQSLLS